MVKRSIAFICIVLMLCQLLVACSKPAADSPDTTPSDTTTNIPQETTSVSVDTTDDNENPETETPIQPVVDNDPATPGKLIYLETFEGYGTTENSNDTLAALGWVKSEKSDGAYENNTSDYFIRSHNGSNQLYVENYTESKSGSDSYVVILNAEQFGYLQKNNYTYQYDVEYTTAASASRYLAIVSSYNGSFYNSFHFRNCGTANNQCHFGTWYTYDDSNSANYAANADAQSTDTIVYKLLGKYYNGSKQAFSGVSVSIRYVVNWETGNRVFMRVNDKNSFSKGEWVLVSESGGEKGSANPYWSAEIGGAAFALKTGAAQNGYIDNIMIWSGTGDEPADVSSPFLTSKTSGHSFETIDGKDICVLCGKTEEQIKNGWWGLGENIPIYTDGTPSKNIYSTGQGTHDKTLSPLNEAPMQLFSNTSPEAFEKYLGVLAENGFTRDYYLSDESGIYASFVKADTRVYTYYTAATRFVRIIDDKVSEASPSDFGYSYTKRPGETTVLYQYGVPMNSAGLNISKNDEKKIDCGMMYVMKLADNSVFIIDGGGYQQFDDAQCDGFMRFLEDVTGAGKTGKIRIAGWYITHSHSDHMAGFCLFAKKYGSRLILERMFCNLPSVYSPESLFANTRGNYTKLTTYIDKYLGNDFKFLKIHTGECLNLGDVKIRVLYTHEDIVNKDTAMPMIEKDFNNSTSVLRIEFDGKSFLLLGDINKPAMNVIMRNVPEKLLKTDVVQVAHHVINDLSKLYNVVCAPVALVPQSPNGAYLNQTRKNAMNAITKYAKSDMIFYASEETTGLSVVNGQLQVTFTDKVHGGAYVTAWGW